MARLSLLAQNGGVHSGRHTIRLTTAWPYTVAGEVQQRKFVSISMAMTTVWVLQVVVGCGQVQEPPRGRLTLDIPTQLKTCTYIVADRVSLAVKKRWLEQYKNTCEMMGVKVETVNANTFQVRGSAYPPNIHPGFNSHASPVLEDFTGPPPKILILKFSVDSGAG